MVFVAVVVFVVMLAVVGMAVACVRVAVVMMVATGVRVLGDAADFFAAVLVFAL